MLTGLKTQGDGSFVIKKFEQRAFKLFFNAKEDRYRKLQGKTPVSHCVSDSSERCPIRRRCVKVEYKHFISGGTQYLAEDL